VNRGGDLVELELPVRPEVVSVARLVVGAIVATEPLFDDERCADLRLAVSEACTNAIQAQLRRPDEASRQAPIVVRCRSLEDRIEVTVTDHGGGFDPDALPAHPAITDPARLEYERGLGIPLIRMLADEHRFDPIPGGTSLFMGFGPRLPGSHSVHETG
jgi:anti-sigma regulatory factor (Ser/Thr protein kinase)